MTYLTKIRLLDLDDLFAYRTPRTVLIRDRKLGISRIAILIALFIYVVIYEVIVQKGYMIKETPTGYVRIGVQQRVESSSGLPYCCDTPGCVQQKFGSARGAMPCVVWDELNSAVPPAEEFSAFLTTRVNVTRFVPLENRCLLNATLFAAPPCPDWEMDPQPTLTGTADVITYYVAEPEVSTYLIVHAVYGQKNDLVMTSTLDMPKARLANSDGDYIRNFCDNANTGDMDIKCDDENPATGRSGDILSLKELLNAADLQPDPATGTYLDRIDSSLSSDTLRYDGLVLVIIIDYAGSGYTKNSIKYTYRVKYVPHAEYKYLEVKDENNGTHTTRTTYNRHGVRVLVVASGWVGKFSFVELLKTLVTGLALLALAGTVTDYVIMKLLPNSDVYRRYKNVRTIDFSDLKRDTRELKDGKELTYGGKHLTDETFVYGELDGEEKLESDKAREAAAEERKEGGLTNDRVPPPDPSKLLSSPSKSDSGKAGYSPKPTFQSPTPHPHGQDAGTWPQSFYPAQSPRNDDPYRGAYPPQAVYENPLHEGTGGTREKRHHYSPRSAYQYAPTKDERL
ncbi:P2X receptor A [Diplonema papillatum]|nr:P2X receptor A [Diplonema papillatum]